MNLPEATWSSNSVPLKALLCFSFLYSWFPFRSQNMVRKKSSFFSFLFAFCSNCFRLCFFSSSPSFISHILYYLELVLSLFRSVACSTSRVAEVPFSLRRRSCTLLCTVSSPFFALVDYTRCQLCVCALQRVDVYASHVSLVHQYLYNIVSHVSHPAYRMSPPRSNCRLDTPP